MSKIFLDACVLIDIISGRQEFDLEILQGNRPFISVLSVHIAHYVARAKCPDENIINLVSCLSLIPLTVTLTNQAMNAPTVDCGDNIQLLSAVENGIDVFVTNDKALLKLHSYQGVKIIHPKDLASYV